MGESYRRRLTPCCTNRPLVEVLLGSYSIPLRLTYIPSHLLKLNPYTDVVGNDFRITVNSKYYIIFC